MISTDRFRVGDLVGAVSDCHGIQLDVVHRNIGLTVYCNRIESQRSAPYV